MDNLYWLKNPIHENLIKFEMTDEFKNKIIKSFDGTIIAVKEEHFECEDDPDDILYKLGYKKKEVKTKKKRGVYHDFIDSEEEFTERVISDMKSEET